MKGPKFLTLTAGLAVLLLALGCSEERARGALSMALTSTSSTGVTYRLTATFDVTGPDAFSAVLRTNDASSTLTLDVAPGAYTLVLRPSWRVSRVEMDGSLTPLTDVVLLQDPSLTVDVMAGATTTAIYRFGVGPQFIAFGEGRIDVQPVFEDALDAGTMGTDECALGLDDCDMNATCTDTASGFECACNSGYLGDGRSCAEEWLVANGQSHTCVLGGGSVYCWGADNVGQTGQGTTSATPRFPAVAVPMLTDVIQLEAGPSHTCALRADGSVACWGWNAFGELGDGTTTARPSPVDLGLTGVVDIAVGANHGCAVLDTGEVRCWGRNIYGEVGDGTSTQRLSPVAVSRITSAVEVVAGANHTCARLADESASCWGRNDYGQLGDGTTTSRSTPAAVTGLAPTRRLTSGFGHVCAEDVMGLLWCWGDNRGGAVGPGVSGAVPTPRLVMLPTVVRASAYQYTSCVEVSGGALQCWGDNSTGALGDGTFANRLTPGDVPLPGPARLVSFGSSSGTVCAQLLSGPLLCWGTNAQRQVGDGTSSTYVTSPSLVTAL